MTNQTPAQKEEALAGMPRGEQSFLHSLLDFTRTAQLNPDRQIVLAAKRWERAIRFRARIEQQRYDRRSATRAPLQAAGVGGHSN